MKLLNVWLQFLLGELPADDGRGIVPLNLKFIVCSNTYGSTSMELFSVMFLFLTSKRLRGAAGSRLMFLRNEAGIGLRWN